MVIMSMSLVARKAASERMKRNNPMKRHGVAAKAMKTKLERHGQDFYTKHWQKIADEGRNGKHIPSAKERAAISVRMTANNPMKRASVVEKRKRSFTPEYRRNLSECMKKTWRDGKITPVMFLGRGNVKAANKTELLLFPILTPMRGRFVGDGTFWLRVTESGISRNPDFIFGSGRKKTALLLHGVFWHQDKAKARAEIRDYRKAGWNLFVLWTKRISSWMLPAIESEILAWLAEVKSSQSKTPVVRQFMTWNARRITTS